MYNTGMDKRLLIAISAITVFAMCAFIFYMSSLVAVESDARSMSIASWLAPLVHPGFDTLSAAQQFDVLDAVDTAVRKIAHCLEYALLGLLVANLFVRIASFRSGVAAPAVACHAPHLLFGAWAASVAYAISDEVHQMFVPGRAGMISDVGIDALGALLGVTALAVMAALAVRQGHRGRS